MKMFNKGWRFEVMNVAKYSWIFSCSNSILQQFMNDWIHVCKMGCVRKYMNDNLYQCQLLSMNVSLNPFMNKMMSKLIKSINIIVKF